MPPNKRCTGSAGFGQLSRYVANTSHSSRSPPGISETENTITVSWGGKAASRKSSNYPYFHKNMK